MVQDVALIAFTNKSLIKRLTVHRKSAPTPPIKRSQGVRTRDWANAGMLQRLAIMIQQFK